MQIPRPTDADRQRFKSLVPDDARVEVKPMFGNLGAFVNGNMFMGLFGTEVGVKLDDADQSQLSDAGGGPFGPTERPMAVTSPCQAGARRRPDRKPAGEPGHPPLVVDAIPRIAADSHAGGARRPGGPGGLEKLRYSLRFELGGLPCRASVEANFHLVAN
jgi:TfoX N-terminal domain